MGKLNQHGKENPYWKGGKTTYNCLECGGEFQAYASERKRGGAKFCSIKCGYENKQQQVELICTYCKKDFTKRKSDAAKTDKHFCSKSCDVSWRSENIRGENHHSYGKTFTYEHRKKIGDAHRGEKNYQWKGGIKSENERIRNSMNYKDWRKEVFERDDYTCQRCLDRNGFGKKIELEAHHILQFADFLEERFEIRNGATLCIDCHNWTHVHEYPHDNLNSVSASIG